MLSVLVAAFILSGAAGLIYESIWTRYLGLFVGHSAYAQIIVLAVFLGGMAIGAAIAARYADRMRQPLLWYGFVELAIGVGGLAFHPVFRATTDVAYASIFPAVHGAPLLIVKWTLAALLLVPQSILLGATFPLMTSAAVRIARASDRISPPGRIIALLYFANSLGAAVGVLVAGFYLLGAFGLPGTLITAGLTNLLAGGVALSLAGWLADEQTAPLAAAQALLISGSLVEQDARIVRSALLVVATLTGTASFIYEVAWVRMLSLVLGSATHAFELMLSAFILGIALGAWWVRTRVDTFRDPLRALAIVQWVMGVLALATIPLYLASFGWTATLLDALSRNDSGYVLFTVARYALCLAIMLPATICAGMTLPLITRTLMVSGGGERAIGTVYSVNTIGSIVGVVLAGLALLPLVGLKTTLMLGAVLDMGLGVFLVVRFLDAIPSARRLFLITAGGGAAILFNIAITQRFDEGVLTSGVYRYAALPRPGARNIAFYRDGRTATVSVRGDSASGYSLATNGKPDASLTPEWLRPFDPGAPRDALSGDQVTQALLPLITLAHVPHARMGAVIGFGSGVSSHILLGSPEIERLVTVEIEPAMVEAGRLFRPANERVYEHGGRSQIMIDDAKSYFAAAHQQFDLIVSEPSNPWVSGVSGLFTQEFYARVRRYLTDTGVFGQWLHMYEMNDALLASVLAAVHRNFASYEMFLVSSVDVLIVATNAPQLPLPDWGVVNYPMVAEQLRRFRPLTPATFEALRLANRRVLAPLLDLPVDVNSDYRPVLDLGAERARFVRAQASGVIGLGVGRFPLGLVLSDRRTPFASDTMPDVAISRPELLALSAAMRRRAAFPDTGNAFDEIRRAQHRLHALRAAMAAGEPEDWNLWLRDAIAVDEDLHGGTAGVADNSFYGEVLNYTTRHRAPARVTSALQFLRAISRWDWIAADSAGERVLENGAPPLGLAVSADLLRDGLVVARLRRGDVDGARKAFNRLVGHGTRVHDDLRTRLLDAWIRREER
jgi:spermidine synthase